MVDERDRARARLGLPPLAATSAPTPAPIVDEQARIQAMRTPAPTRTASPASFRKFEETGQSLETPTPTGITGSDDAAARAAAEAAARAAAEAAAAAEAKAAAEAAAAAAKTAAELAAARAALDAANQAAAAAEARATAAEAAARTAADRTAADSAARARGERQSAYDLLYSEFNKYGLGSLVTPLRDLITSGVSPSEFTIRLRETDAYKKRFVANEARIKNGLRALSEAEYIRDEDAYQEVMRRRGLPPEYYAKGDMGIQKGFEKLISGDVSSAELEDRIVAAQERVIRGAPQIAQALKEFYPEISNGDILAYALDPANAIDMIKRKVTAAEIGGAQLGAGLKATVSGAETLASAGVTGERYQQAAPTIAEASIRGGQLASIYGEDPYTQQTAEQEVFNIAGAQEARKQRQKVTGLEKVTFGGKTGLTSGAFARDRAGEL
jgi:hypothetical protein